MINWKNVMLRSIPAFIGICIIFVVSMFLSTSKYYTTLIRYGYPICSIDRHQFEGDECPACGRSITNSGVFYSVDIVIENPFSEDYSLSFTDFYGSFGEFQKDYSYVFNLTLIVLSIIALEVCFYIYLILHMKKMNRQGRRLKAREER